MAVPISERGRGSAPEIEVAPITHLTEGDVREIAGMYRGALIRTRRAYRLIDSHDSTEANRVQTERADENSLSALAFESVLRFLGQKKLADTIKADVYHPSRR